MKQVYETYSNNSKLSPLVREITWSNNLAIISKINSDAEKEFYLKLSIKDNLTEIGTEKQIDSGLFERVITSNTNLSPVLRETHNNVESIFKKNYVLDFLALPTNHSEKTLGSQLLRI